MTALIQNFSVPAGNDVEIDLQVTPNPNIDTLEDCTLYWRVYQQKIGIPDHSVPAIISKSTLDGSIVVIPSPPMMAKILIFGVDTTALLRNYYHETTLIDVANHKSTINCGIMTVTESLNAVP